LATKTLREERFEALFATCIEPTSAPEIVGELVPGMKLPQFYRETVFVGQCSQVDGDAGLEERLAFCHRKVSALTPN
jgi:hypothetical protein